jgi:hypothetical protein
MSGLKLGIEEEFLNRIMTPSNAQTPDWCIDLNPARTPASLLGGHSACDPPDPISNSAVKPGSADGTSAQALEE